MADATEGMDSKAREATAGSEDSDKLSALIAATRGKRVVVFGDLIADEFVYGRIARVSREAPVLILEYDATEVVPGGAGNAANNVASLGGVVRLVSLVGRDEAGRRLFKVLSRAVERAGLSRPAGFRTPVKTRILAGGIHSAKQQVVRIDRYAAEPVTDAQRAVAERAARRAVRTADAVLISDYGTGLVTPELARVLAKAVAARKRRRRIPILIDSRYDLLRYRGLTACTPNESEVEQLTGIKIGDDVRALEKAGRDLLKRTGMTAVLITRGSRGMALFEHRQATIHLPIFGSDEVADVTGAGDTVIATVALAVAAGGSFYEAARLANYAGGLVVMKRGTATVSPAELREAIQTDHYAPTESWSQEGPEQGRK